MESLTMVQDFISGLYESRSPSYQTCFDFPVPEALKPKNYWPLKPFAASKVLGSLIAYK